MLKSSSYSSYQPKEWCIDITAELEYETLLGVKEKMSDKTKEPQYQSHVELRDKKGLSRLGLRANATWDADPRRLLFMLARYKFVAKMLAGKDRVLEVGCGDAFGTRLVVQEVGSVCALDFDETFIKDVQDRMDDKWKFELKVHDMLTAPLAEKFDAAYALDVLEHIPSEHEERFVSNIAMSLKDNGVLIIGLPSIESQAHASSDSKEGHINCKSGNELKELMSGCFDNVFVFSMNDEVVHTGFYPMAHYLFGLCVGVTLKDKPQ